LLDRSNPSVFEDLQAEVESLAATVISELRAATTDTLTSEQREIMQRFLVLHLSRHPRMMKNIRESADVHLGPLEDSRHVAAMRQDLLAHAVSWVAYFGGPNHDLASNAGRWERYRREFDQFSWNLVRFDKPSLIIGDTLVCTSAILPVSSGATTDRAYNIGISVAERITVPLTPQLGLLLSRGGKLRTLSAIAFNRTTAGNALEFAAYATDWPDSSPDLYSSVDDDLQKRRRDRARPLEQTGDRTEIRK